MKTIPYIEDLLEESDGSQANYLKAVEIGSKFISELLTYGDEAIGLCMRIAEKRDRRADVILLALIRRNVAYLDSIGVLLKSSCAETCFPLMRSLLEGTFGIAHIVQERHEERALAYQFVRLHRIIKKLRRADTSQATGRELEKDLADDAFVPEFLKQLPKDLGERADRYESELLSREDFAPVWAEWNRLKAPPVHSHPCPTCGKKIKHLKDPEWYTLFGGARDMRSLAVNLKWPSMYEFAYKDWSIPVHAGDALDNFSTPGGRIRPLHYPADYLRVFSLAFVLFMNGFERYTSFFDESMAYQVRKYTLETFNVKFQAIEKRLQKPLEQVARYF